MYTKTSNSAAIARLTKPARSSANPPDSDGEYVREGQTNAVFHNGLPLLKPPYGRLTAIDLNRGATVWQTPFGDDARLRAHPALKGVPLLERLGVAGAQGVIVTRSGLIFAGGGDTAMHAVDASDGRELWKYPLPRRTSGTPMTYSYQGRQYLVIATGAGADAALVAFALP